MSFPTDPTDLDIEMNLGGNDWYNLRTTGFVLDRGITISRGRADESGQIEPSKLSMTLDNVGGTFSPRNATGPFYGLLGRNVPVRASVKRGSSFMEVLGDGSKATCPDATALGITGDIDIRIDITTDSWGNRNLAGKFAVTGNQRSWGLQLGADGTIRLNWTTAGTSATAAAAISTLPVPMYPGRRALRVTLDVNNGAGSNTTTFYTAPTISGPWTQLGDPVVGALGTSGTTSIYDSTAPIEVGNVADLPSVVPISDRSQGIARPLAGRVNAFELRSGINGTVVANPVFTSPAIGTTSFADTASSPNTWTLQGNAQITNRRWRFWGEMSSLPVRWDISGNDLYVPVDATGILRRLRQNELPLNSPMYRQTVTEDNVVAYWPCEDGNDATRFAAASDRTRAGTISGSPSMSSSDVFTGSEALPTVSGSKWTFVVPRYTAASSGSSVSFLLYIPTSSAPANNTILARLSTSGTADRWDLVYSTGSGGGLSLGVYSASDEAKATPIFAPGLVIATGINDRPWLVSIGFQQSGTTIKFDFALTLINGNNGRLISSQLAQTASSQSCGVATRLVIAPNGGVDGVTVGHVSVQNTIPTSTEAITNGFIGETAGKRIERICTEEGIAFRNIGDIRNTVPMGPQGADTFSAIIQECADADLGMIFEPRDMLGIGYRTRSSFYNQPVIVALDYAASEVSGTLDPTDDDQAIVNDITVARSGGSSYRYQVTDGPLSTQPPPDGIGRYQGSVTINVADDSTLGDQASWRAHMGTVDEARYPTIGADFRAPGVIGNTALNEALLALEVGDRVTIDNPPEWLPPEEITQIVQGISESYGNYAHDLTCNTSPESPFRIGVCGTSRIDTSGSVLATTVVSPTATSISVSTTSGEVWTTDPSVMPFDIWCGGERMRVTAISGTTSPQTFTVTRSVNGVTKGHADLTAIHLADQEYVGL